IVLGPTQRRPYSRRVLPGCHAVSQLVSTVLREPRPGNLHQETTKQDLSALTVKTCPRLLLLPLALVDLVLRAVACIDLHLDVGAQPLIDPEPEDDQDGGDQDRCGIKHERDV